MSRAAPNLGVFLAQRATTMKPNAGTRWRRLKRAAIVSGVCALALIVLPELAFRLWLFGLAGLSVAKMNSMVSFPQAGVLQASPNLEIQGELKPNLDVLYHLAPLRTNSAGLADREYPLQPPPGVFRIAVVGSSISMPVGVAVEKSWHARLEARLNRGAERGLREVINFAVCAYDARQLLAVLTKKVPSYHPNLILFELTKLDGRMVRDEWFYHRRYLDRPPRVGAFFSHSFLWERLFSERRRIVGGPDGDAWLTRAIDAGVAMGRTTPVCFVVLVDSGLADRIRGRGASCVIDVVDSVAGLSTREFQVIPTLDGHPSIKAHRIFGDAVYRALREQAIPGLALK
jgi:hypothetical protein